MEKKGLYHYLYTLRLAEQTAIATDEGVEPRNAKT